MAGAIYDDHDYVLVVGHCGLEGGVLDEHGDVLIVGHCGVLNFKKSLILYLYLN